MPHLLIHTLQVLLYSTVMGSIGVLAPLSSREDVDFFSHLEMHLRQEAPPLAGRDHLAFRSAYWPVRNAVDGDLCNTYAAVSTFMHVYYVALP